MSSMRSAQTSGGRVTNPIILTDSSSSSDTDIDMLALPNVQSRNKDADQAAIRDRPTFVSLQLSDLNFLEEEEEEELAPALLQVSAASPPLVIPTVMSSPTLTALQTGSDHLDKCDVTRPPPPLPVPLPPSPVTPSCKAVKPPKKRRDAIHPRRSTRTTRNPNPNHLSAETNETWGVWDKKNKQALLRRRAGIPVVPRKKKPRPACLREKGRDGVYIRSSEEENYMTDNTTTTGYSASEEDYDPAPDQSTPRSDSEYGLSSEDEPSSDASEYHRKQRQATKKAKQRGKGKARENKTKSSGRRSTSDTESELSDGQRQPQKYSQRSPEVEKIFTQQAKSHPSQIATMEKYFTTIADSEPDETDDEEFLPTAAAAKTNEVILSETEDDDEDERAKEEKANAVRKRARASIRVEQELSGSGLSLAKMTEATIGVKERYFRPANSITQERMKTKFGHFLDFIYYLGFPKIAQGGPFPRIAIYRYLIWMVQLGRHRGRFLNENGEKSYSFVTIRRTYSWIKLHQEYGVQQEPSDNDFPAVSLTHTSRAVEDGSLIGLHSFCEQQRLDQQYKLTSSQHKIIIYPADVDWLNERLVSPSSFLSGRQRRWTHALMFKLLSMTSARVAEVAQRTLNYKEQVGIANEVGGGRATGILYKDITVWLAKRNHQGDEGISFYVVVNIRNSKNPSRRGRIIKRTTFYSRATRFFASDIATQIVAWCFLHGAFQDVQKPDQMVDLVGRHNVRLDFKEAFLKMPFFQGWSGSAKKGGFNGRALTYDSLLQVWRLLKEDLHLPDEWRMHAMRSGVPNLTNSEISTNARTNLLGHTTSRQFDRWYKSTTALVDVQGLITREPRRDQQIQELNGARMELANYDEESKIPVFLRTKARKAIPREERREGMIQAFLNHLYYRDCDVGPRKQPDRLAKPIGTLRSDAQGPFLHQLLINERARRASRKRKRAASDLGEETD